MEKEFETINELYIERVKHSRIMSWMLFIANLILLPMLVLMLWGCEPAVEPTREFIIRKGDHYASPTLSESLQSRKLVFEAKFNESAQYDFGNDALQSNKNKLMGFCDSNSLPHQNSARFAWQWYNNRLEIYAYCYFNGERQEQFIGVVPINEYSRYELELSSDHYIFKLNDQAPVLMKRASQSEIGTFFKLWPYFGGQIAAPHDVTIDIKTIY